MPRRHLPVRRAQSLDRASRQRSLRRLADGLRLPTRADLRQGFFRPQVEPLEERTLLALFQLQPATPVPSGDLTASDAFPLMGFGTVPSTSNGFANHKVAHSFTSLFSGLPSVPFDKIRTATLELQVRAGGSGLNVANDVIVVGAYGSGLPGAVWTGSFSSLVAGWTNGTVANLTLDLSNLPVTGGPNVNLLPLLNAHGMLDVKVHDDTGVDFYKLSLQRVAVWSGAGDGTTWSQSANWVNSALPVTGDDVYLPNVAATTNVNLNTSATLRGLVSDEPITISSSGVALDVSATSQLNAGGTLSAGTITGTGDRTLSGTFTWSGGTLTGAGKTVVSSGATLAMQGGTLTAGVHTIQGLGTVTWTQGTLTGGPLTVNVPSFQLSGSSTTTLQNGTLVNAGTAVWSGTGNWDFRATSTSQSAVFQNLAGAVFEVQNNASLFTSVATGPRTFTNAGTFRKVTATGTTTIGGAVFDNTGTIDVQSGTVSFQSNANLNVSSVLTGAGVVEVAGGTTTVNSPTPASNVRLTGGTLAVAQDLTLSGTFTWSGGMLTGAGKTVVSSGATLAMQGGTLTAGAHTIQGLGTVTWTQGTLTGGPLTVNVPSFQLSGSSSKTLQNGTLVNAGTAVWSGTGSLDFRATSTSQSAVFQNLAGAVFEVQNNASLFTSPGFGTGPRTFTNAGTFRKVTATGTTTISDAVFDNTGTIDVQSGTVVLSGGGTHTGSVQTALGATLEFGGGTADWNAGLSISGSGTVRVSGGTVNVNVPLAVPNLTLSGGTLNEVASLTVGGTMTWSGGTLSGAAPTVVSSGATLAMQGGTAGVHTIQGLGTVTWTQGTLTGGPLTMNVPSFQLSGSSTKILQNGTLVNAGTAVWSGTGSLDFRATSTSQSAVFQNLAGAVFEVQNNASLFTSPGFGTGPRTFTNAGTFRKVTATGTTTISDAVFDNTGTIDVQSGTVALTGGLTNFSGTTLTGGTYRVKGTLSFPGANIQNNAAAVVLDGPSSQIRNSSNNADALAAFATNTASGSFTLQGGRNFTTAASFSNAGQVAIASGSTLTLPAGQTYSQSAGSTLVDGTLSAPLGVTIAGGTLAGSGTLAGGLTNSGQLSPGTSPGTLTINGNYAQTASGVLDIEVGGTAAGQFDRLIVTGTATLDGTLNVNLVGSYVPNVGDSFEILTFGSRVGDFATKNGLTLPGGKQFAPVYGASSLALVTQSTNQPPLLDPIANQTVNEGTLLSVTASASDPDAGQTLSFSLDAGFPAGMSIHPTSGQLTWTPTEDQGPGVYTVTVRVTDDGTPPLSATRTFQVTVDEVNLPPVVDPIADQAVNEGATLSLTVSASDPDLPANTLSFSLDAGFPAGMSIHPTSGLVTWTPTALQGPATYTVTVRATDNGTPPASGTRTFSVTVHDVLSPFTVTNTLDSGTGSLRQAILNANAAPGADVIQFNLPGPGVQTIAPLSALPTITEAVTIDGYSQPGASPNTLATGNNAVLRVELSGASAPAGTSGLTITAAGSVIKGLVINRFAAHGILITGSGASGNSVQGNYVGTNATGTAALGNGSGSSGVHLSGGAKFNIVGTDGDGVGDAAEGNVISGNGRGIGIQGTGTDENVVAGNLIGLTASGTTALGNNGTGDGVWIVQGAQKNRVGTNGDGVSDLLERNVISGHTFAGVAIYNAQTHDNIVAGNYIGTDVTGTLARGNQWGVALQFTGGGGPMRNRIGTNGDGIADAAERNVISGNTSHGVLITGAGTDNNIVAGNYIGTTATGTAALSNGGTGIIIQGVAKNNRIGTDGSNDAFNANERNVISGNGVRGVWIAGVGTDQNVVAGNYIGTNADGTAALANANYGLLISGGAQNNRVGTNGDGAYDDAERNVISGNASVGVYLSDAGTDQNIVAGNYIGTNPAGTGAIPNGGVGVQIDDGAKNNRIGTDGSNDAFNANERNVISGNSGRGVWIAGTGTDQNIVAGNYIGTSVDSTSALANGSSGVEISGGAKSNRVGTNGDGVADAAERNVISGNNGFGVLITGSGTDNNIVAGNYIGTDKDGNGRGTISWWKAEGNANDAVGARNGTLNGGATFAPGLVGQAFSFNGTTAYVQVPQSSPVSPRGSFTLEAWVNLAAYPLAGHIFAPVFSKWNDLSTNQRSYALVVQPDGSARFDVSTNGLFTAASPAPPPGANSAQVQSAPGSVPLNSWTHLAAVFNAQTQTLRLYVNGIQQQDYIGSTPQFLGGNPVMEVAVPFDNTAFFESHPLLIGAGDVGSLPTGREFLQGKIDEPAIYSRALGNDEIQAIYAAGSAGKKPDLANRGAGVQVQVGAKNNWIGTNGDGSPGDALEGNLISGNVGAGVLVGGSGTNQNVVAGNRIGVTAAGNAPLGNVLQGIHVASGAAFTRIGTNADGVSDAAERNVVSGNMGNGIIVISGSQNTVVAGNYVGTDVGGQFSITNGDYFGVFASSTSQSTRIGTDGLKGVNNAAERNVISGNPIGIGVADSGTTGTVIAGNYIGLNAAGTAALPNRIQGIELKDGSSQTRIGTNSDGQGDTDERNVISGNRSFGVWIRSGVTQTVVAGNYIGTDPTGTTPIGNASHGLVVSQGASNNRLGTNGDGLFDAVEGNRIWFNAGNGIQVDSSTPDLFNLGLVDPIIAGTIPTITATGTVPQADLQDFSFSPPSTNWAFNHPIPGGGGDQYVVRVTGTLQVNAAGTFTFGYSGDDGGRLRIDGNTIINDNTVHAFTNVFGNATLAAGTHTFEWIGFERNGQAAFELSVAVGSGKTAPITTANGWRVLGDPSPHPEIALVGGLNVTVYYTQPPKGNSIRGNAIDQNTGLGINLAPSGVTPNDVGDADSGANLLQNFPALLAAAAGATTRVAGTLSSAPNTTYVLDFYASPAADPSGYGEGARWLGFATVATDAAGNASFDVVLSGASVAGEWITATATDSAGNTSEFSAALMASGLLAGELLVGGGLGNDVLEVTAGSVNVRVNGVSLGSFVPSVKVRVLGFDGNDTLLVSGNLGVPVELEGSTGDDTYKLNPVGLVSIHDSGGNDTLDFSISTQNVSFIIQTTSGSATDGDAVVSYVGTIERFIGTPLNDLFVDQTSQPQLTLLGGGGNDIYFLVPGSTIVVLDDAGDDEYSINGTEDGELAVTDLGGSDLYTEMGGSSVSLFDQGAGSDQYTLHGSTVVVLDDGGDDDYTIDAGTDGDITITDQGGSDVYFETGGASVSLFDQGTGSDQYMLHGSTVVVLDDGGDDDYTIDAGTDGDITITDQGGSDVYFETGGASVSLFDQGTGSDQYMLHGSTVVVLDDGGDDDYTIDAGTDGDITITDQGGSDVYFETGGASVSLFDQGTGRDQYTLHGSTVVVLDDGGDDDYTIDAGTDGDITITDQGGSDVYFETGGASVSLFDQGEGNDQYTLHGSTVVVLDDGGDDDYTIDADADGDITITDQGGSDAYFETGGASVSLFDQGEGNDQYTLHGSTVVVLDDGGDDDYTIDADADGDITITDQGGADSYFETGGASITLTDLGETDDYYNLEGSTIRLLDSGGTNTLDLSTAGGLTITLTQVAGATLHAFGVVQIKDAQGNVTGQIFLGDPNDPAKTTQVSTLVVPDTAPVVLTIQQIDQRNNSNQPPPTFSGLEIEGAGSNLNLSLQTLDQRTGSGTQAPPPQYTPPIINETPLPILRVTGPGRVTETNSGFFDVVYTIEWTNPVPGGSIPIELVPLSLTGTLGSDFELIDGTPTTFDLTSNSPSFQIGVRVFGDTTFEPDETFAIQARTMQQGASILAEQITTILNDDSPQLAPSSTKDDGDWGFSLRGIWTVDTSGAGWKGDYRTQSSTSTSVYASWTLGVTPGMYRVYATWVPADNRTSQAQYTINSGATLLGTTSKDQKLAPDDGLYDGKNWELLGTYTVSGSAITVRLNNAGSGLMVADGIIAVPVSPLHVAGAVGEWTAGEELTDHELQTMASEAIARWAAAGASAEQLAQLQNTVLVVADLPPGLLGLASSQVIWIDRDAAGSGWYVDPTPRDDADFARVATAVERWADPSSPAAGRIDLLTAVVHELGHILGLDDHEGSDAMGWQLPAGVRRLPTLDASVPRMAEAAGQRPLHESSPQDDVAQELVAMAALDLPTPGNVTTAPPGLSSAGSEAAVAKIARPGLHRHASSLLRANAVPSLAAQVVASDAVHSAAGGWQPEEPSSLALDALERLLDELAREQAEPGTGPAELRTDR